MVEFISFTNNRKPAFRVITQIVSLDGRRFVTKDPASDEANDHLDRIARSMQYWTKTEHFKYVSGTTEVNKVTFEYIEGESFAKRLISHLDAGLTEHFLQALIGYCRIVMDEMRPYFQPFRSSESFQSCFGPTNTEDFGDSLTWGNLDWTFDNVIIQDQGYVIIDPEWVMDYPIPFAYILFRAMNKFYVSTVKGKYEHLVQYAQLIAIANISSEQEAIFRCMEEHFIQHIFADSQVKNQPVLSIVDLISQNTFVCQAYLTDPPNETNSGFYNIVGNQMQCVLVELNDFQARTIRFDPMMSHGIIFLHSCQGIDQQGKTVSLTCTSDSELSIGNILCFSHDDPKLFIALPDHTRLVRLKIDFQILSANSSGIQVMTQYLKQHFLEMIDQVGGSSQEITSIDEEMHLVAVRLQDMTENLKNINENYHTLDSYHQLLAAEHSQLKKTLTDMTAEYSQLKRTFADVTVEHSQLKKTLTGVTAEYSKLKSTFADVTTESDRQLAYLKSSLAHIDKLNDLVREVEKDKAELSARLATIGIRNKVKIALQAVKCVVKRVARKLGLTHDSLIVMLVRHPEKIGKGFQIIGEGGFKALVQKIRNRHRSVIMPHHPELDYNELLSSPMNLLISILMPVYNVDVKWLDLAVKSVIKQSYPNWQLCIVDDASTNRETVSYLKMINDPRIKIKHLEKNQGIAGASNMAAEMADGLFLALMDHDDELDQHAMYAMAKAITEGDSDILYSDEDKIDLAGNHRFPFFKPDWSPDLLHAQMYLGHLFCMRKSLFQKAGGFSDDFNGSQDYDLAFRLTEMSGKIWHIARILYSWREIPSSTATNPEAKPYAHLAGLKALDAHLKRQYGPMASASETDNYFVYEPRFDMDEGTHKVSIIIPIKDNIDLTKNCVHSIIEKTSYRNFEIIIVDNRSEKSETKEWLNELHSKYEAIRVIQADYQFNWSRLNNDAVKASSGDVLVFLNNDTAVISPDWLGTLASHALRLDIATVGALLLYPDETIQHAGIVIGIGGWADHVFKGFRTQHFGSPFVSPMVMRNVSANTGACLAISRTHFLELGGFNEQYQICGSDVELSTKASNAGYFNIYVPSVRLYHFESKSRDSYIPEIDFKLSYANYELYRQHGDPFYNANLSYKTSTPVPITADSIQ